MPSLQNDDFWNEIATAQVSAGASSFLASFAIVGFILCRDRGNEPRTFTTSRRRVVNDTSPYQRLVFGLSIFDIIKSIGTVIGPFTIPSGETLARWAKGSKFTCQLDGFLFCVGSNGVQMYTLALCVYYVCKLNRKMSDDAFQQRLEKKMHTAIAVLNFGMYVTAAILKVLNVSPTGTLCYPSAYPTGCRHDEELECEELSERFFVYYFVLNSILVPLLCFVGICVCMTMLLWHALRQEKIFGGGAGSRLYSSATSSSGSFGSRLRARWRRDSMTNAEDVISRRTSGDGHGDGDGRATTSSSIRRNSSTTEHRDSLSRLYKRELVIQAFSFLVVFCLTSLPFTILHFFCLTGSDLCSDPWILRVNHLFFPLGGLFHIIVYTRPKVAYVRRMCPNVGILYASWLVLRSGGEVPNLDGIDEDGSCCYQLFCIYLRCLCCRTAAVVGSNRTISSRSRGGRRNNNNGSRRNLAGGRFPPRLQRPPLVASSMSSVQFAAESIIIAPPPPVSSIPNSNAAIVNFEISPDDDNKVEGGSDSRSNNNNNDRSENSCNVDEEAFAEAALLERADDHDEPQPAASSIPDSNAAIVSYEIFPMDDEDDDDNGSDSRSTNDQYSEDSYKRLQSQAFAEAMERLDDASFDIPASQLSLGDNA